MKQSRFTEEQIIGVLKESEQGVPTGEMFRKYGISDARRLKTPEHENRRLTQTVAEQALNIQALKYVYSENFSSPKRNGKP